MLDIKKIYPGRLLAALELFKKNFRVVFGWFDGAQPLLFKVRVEQTRLSSCNETQKYSLLFEYARMWVNYFAESYLLHL